MHESVDVGGGLIAWVGLASVDIRDESSSRGRPVVIDNENVHNLITGLFCLFMLSPAKTLFGTLVDLSRQTLVR